ncbi:MAG: serine/threonine protein kinase, partial [Limisphaerales bacterium]
DLFSTGVVLGNLLLGYNVFKGSNADESRDRIMTLPLPNFSQINPNIDQRLNEILQRTLARDLSQRYATADELLYDLEYYIYHKGYGPTNETLGKYMRELFGQTSPEADDKGHTTVVDAAGRRPVRVD